MSGNITNQKHTSEF